MALLLKYGANPHQANSKGESPLDVSLNEDTRKLLRKETTFKLASDESDQSASSPEAVLSKEDILQPVATTLPITDATEPLSHTPAAGEDHPTDDREHVIVQDSTADDLGIRPLPVVPDENITANKPAADIDNSKLRVAAAKPVSPVSSENSTRLASSRPPSAGFGQGKFVLVLDIENSKRKVSRVGFSFLLILLKYAGI